MKYTLIFLSLGSCLILLSFRFGITGLPILWFGANLAAVGAAYGWLGAKVFGKQSDGSLARCALCLLLPYFLLTWTIWHLQRLISQERCCHEITSAIWLGRRAFAYELPDNISLIVDLTAEFPEPSDVILGKTYISIPTLDASVPSMREFQALIQTITSWQGNVYIHCALGHGRSATVVGATLLSKGLVDNVKQVEQLLKKARPGISFSHAQRQMLEVFCQKW